MGPEPGVEDDFVVRLDVRAWDRGSLPRWVCILPVCILTVCGWLCVCLLVLIAGIYSPREHGTSSPADMSPWGSEAISLYEFESSGHGIQYPVPEAVWACGT